ncbi:MAG: hypothetical protein MRY64_12770, partial [Hyphomonadaceae bacterium]|nr:hypothetical protein [Hyphomonadaceae bacterium]
GDDRLIGGEGNDYLSGDTGSDTYVVGLGDDVIYDDGVAADVDTVLFGYGLTLADLSITRLGNGDVFFEWDAGSLVINSPFGTYDAIEMIAFEDGTELLLAELTLDTLGTDGDETLYGRDTGLFIDDIIHARSGDDTIYGYAGDDQLFGEDGSDRIYGEDGFDRLFGGTSRDFLYGGDRDDWLEGGAANDYLSGGGASDLFVGTLADLNGDEISDFDFYDDGLVVLGQQLTAASFSVVANGSSSSLLLIDGDLDGITDATISINGTTIQTNPIQVRTWGSDTLIGFGSNSVYVAPSNVTNITGAGGDDTITGNSRNNTVWGRVGNDIIDGAGGLDSLYGDWGNDTLIGGAGADSLYGEMDDDLLQGGEDDDQLFGGYGNDRLEGGLGADSMFGEAGNDTIVLDTDDIRVDGNGIALDMGGAGFDTLELAAGTRFVTNRLSLYGFEGFIGAELNDRVRGDLSDVNYRLEGGAGDDELTGNNGDDVLIGGAGSDLLLGNGGDDRLVIDTDDILRDSNGAIDIGGAGFDTLVIADDSRFVTNGLAAYGLEGFEGGSANDRVRGNLNTVDYVLNGGAGDDELSGRGGNDTLIGGLGSDTLTGADGDDRIVLDADDVRLNSSGRALNMGGAGYDTLVMEAGSRFATSVLSAYGFEAFVGADQDDRVRGNRNAVDYDLDGGAGNDDLEGSGGDDRLVGNTGDDTLTGSGGRDTFAFDASHAGADTVTDFSANDFIELTGFGYANAGAAAADFQQAGGNVVFSNGGVSITFTSANLAEVLAAVQVGASPHPAASPPAAQDSLEHFDFANLNQGWIEGRAIQDAQSTVLVEIAMEYRAIVREAVVRDVPEKDFRDMDLDPFDDMHFQDMFDHIFM